jgi:hypothetical protein
MVLVAIKGKEKTEHNSDVRFGKMRLLKMVWRCFQAVFYPLYGVP